MYDVGPYTVAPIKVVWRRMDRRINAAVVGPVEGEGGQARFSDEGSRGGTNASRKSGPDEN